ncbi:hypothetical protein [Hathewaya massiliensis]|uniref:hypothetical protein n=1 Tax=Hathewaya massiliensis TaxID=1964382 RepID=UPI00115B1111|nr:hypothetical protein [Hathewaya massiliensis]
MYILNLKYHMYKKNNMILINNEVDNSLACAINLNNINFTKLEKVLYTGFDKEVIDITNEQRYAIQILEKYPKLFDSNNTEDECIMKSYLRNHIITFRSSFIRKDPYFKIEDFINKYKTTNCKTRVALITKDNRFDFLLKMLSSLPIIDFEYIDYKSIKEVNLKSFEFIVIEDTLISELKEVENLNTAIISINVDKDNISVGPLIFSEKFNIPESNHLNEEIFDIGIGEQSLIFFFVERIIFITTLKLYNEINVDIMLPIRNVFTINKQTLQGKSEYVLLVPKQSY